MLGCLPSLASVSFGWIKWGFLSHVVSAEGVSVDPQKVEAVSSGKDPQL